MRILVGNGKMVQTIRRSSDIVFSHNDIEITETPVKLAKLLRSAFHSNRSQSNLWSDDNEVVVVNTAAKINLEWCESNREEAWKVNVEGALNLAKACDTLGYKFVQVSSGCIFNGEESGHVYSEDDVPTPASFYAVTKATADDYIANANLDIPVLTLRPRQIISITPNATNMLTKFMNLVGSPKFITSANSVTCLEDFGKMLDHLLNVKAVGVYNCASHSTISPYEIAVKLKDLRHDFDPQPTEYKDYLNSIDVKRVNTILSVEKLQRSGYATRSAEDAVDWCVEHYGKV